MQGRLVEALQVYRDSLTTADRLVKADPSITRYQHGLATTLNNMGSLRREMKQPKAAPDPSKPNYHEMYTQGKREIFRVW